MSASPDWGAVFERVAPVTRDWGAVFSRVSGSSDHDRLARVARTPEEKAAANREAFDAAHRAHLEERVRTAQTLAELGDPRIAAHGPVPFVPGVPPSQPGSPAEALARQASLDRLALAQLDAPPPVSRSIGGEFVAGLEGGIAGLMGTNTYQPSPPPEGAGVLRTAAQSLAGTAGSTALPLAAGVAAGAATGGLGTLAVLAASAAPFALDAAGRAYDRTGGDRITAAAAGAVSGAMGAVPVGRILERLPGIRKVVEGRVRDRLMNYAARRGTDATLGGATEVAQAFAEEEIAQLGGATPEQINAAEQFLSGFALTGAFGGVADVATRGRKPGVGEPGGTEATAPVASAAAESEVVNAQTATPLETSPAPPPESPTPADRLSPVPDDVDRRGSVQERGVEDGPNEPPTAGVVEPGMEAVVGPDGAPSVSQPRDVAAGVAAPQQGALRPVAEMTRNELLTEARSLGVLDRGPKTRSALAQRVEAARTDAAQTTPPPLPRSPSPAPEPRPDPSSLSSPDSTTPTMRSMPPPKTRQEADAIKSLSSTAYEARLRSATAAQLLEEAKHLRVEKGPKTKAALIQRLNAEMRRYRSTWAKTAEEYRDETNAGGALPDWDRRSKENHRRLVAEAVENGKPVPPEVLAAYANDELVESAKSLKVAEPITKEPSVVPQPNAVAANPTAPTADAKPRVPASSPPPGPRLQPQAGPVSVQPQRTPRGTGTQTPSTPASIPPRVDSPATPPQQAGRATPLSERALQRLDAIEARAKARLKGEGVPRGKGRGRSGATTLIHDAISVGQIVAVRAARAAVKGGRALDGIVRTTIAELAPSLRGAEIRVRRIASGILADSRASDGAIDDAALERAVDETDALRSRGGRAAARRRIREAVKESGPGRTEPKTVTEPEALRSGLRKAERAALSAFKAGREEAVAEMRVRLDSAVADLRSKRRSEKYLTDTLSAFARESLPRDLQGRFLDRIVKATTPARFYAVARAMQADLGRWEAVRAIREIERYAAKRRMLQLADDPALSGGSRRAEAKTLVSKAVALKGVVRKGSPVAGRTVIAVADELRTIRERLHNLHHDQKREHEVYVGGRRRAVETLRKPVQDALTKRTAIKAKSDTPEAPEVNRMRRWVRRWVSPDSIARLIDNDWKGKGAAHRVLVKEFWAASNVRNRIVQDAQNDAEVAALRAGYRGLGDAFARLSGTLGRADQETVDVSAVGGVGGFQKLTKGQAMEIAAKDPETVRKIAGGGVPVVFSDAPNSPFELTRAQYDHVVSSLSAKEVAFVRDLKAIVHGMFERLDEAHRRANGRGIERVHDYWPVLRKMSLADTVGVAQSWRSVFAKHWEESGILKAREGGKTPIVVGDLLSVWSRHMDTAANIIAYSEPVRTAEMVLLAPEIRSLMAAKLGDAAVSRVEEIVRDVSGAGTGRETTGVERRVAGLTRRVGRALTSINPKTWMRQFGGVFTLMPAMPMRAWKEGLARGLFDVGLDRRIKDASPFFWARWHAAPHNRYTGLGATGAIEPETGLGRAAKAVGSNVVRGRLSDADKALQHAADAIRVANFFDAMPARVAWAGYEWLVNRRHPEWSAARKTAWVAKRAEEAFRRTQNTTTAEDSSGLFAIARRSPMVSPFLQFASQPLKSVDMLYQAHQRGGADRLKALGAVAANAAWSAGLVTGGSALFWYAVYAALGDEERAKEYMQRAKSGATWGLAQETIGIVPGMADVLDLARAVLRGEQYSGPLRNPVMDVAAGVGQGLYQMGRGAVNAMSEETAKRDRAAGQLVAGAERAALKAVTALGVGVESWWNLGKRVRDAVVGGAAEAPPLVR